MRFMRACGAVLVVFFLVGGAVSAHAQQRSDTAEMAAQIDEIAEDQKAILATLAEMKEQLRIITIRVTQAQ